MASGDLSFSYAQGQLTASAADLYVIPTSPAKTLMHAELILCNVDTTTAYKADIHITTASGGAVSAANQIINQESGVSSIAPGETVTMQINQHPPAGYAIRGLADTTLKLTYFLSCELREN